MSRKKLRSPLIPALNAQTVAQKTAAQRTKEVQECQTRVTALLAEYGCKLVPDLMHSFDGQGASRFTFQIRIIG